MEDETQTEFLLQVSVMATDVKDACNKVTGGKIIAAAPMPSSQSGQARFQSGGQKITPGTVITRSQGGSSQATGASAAK